jgi:2-methylisocitrate lyase-like PEP mutase family enzyme
MGPGVALAVLAEAGVKRVSIGGSLYRAAMTATRKALTDLQDGRLDTAFKGVVTGGELGKLLPQN